jgi:hypothetical protein
MVCSTISITPINPNLFPQTNIIRRRPSHTRHRARPLHHSRRPNRSRPHNHRDHTPFHRRPLHRPQPRLPTPQLRRLPPLRSQPPHLRTLRPRRKPTLPHRPSSPSPALPLLSLRAVHQARQRPRNSNQRFRPQILRRPLAPRRQARILPRSLASMVGRIPATIRLHPLSCERDPGPSA